MATPQTLLQRLRHAIQQSTPCAAGSLRLHTLFSTPKVARELYPFAHVSTTETNAANALDATEELIFCTVSWQDNDDSVQSSQPVVSSAADSQGTNTPTPKSTSQRRLILALECFLYTVPSQKAALLYVSKIDSSGWGPLPVPSHLQPFLESGAGTGASLTRSLVTAFLTHFASLAHWSTHNVQHCAIHVLARAQPTYLFPSSPENARKHVLSDGLLIRWWRSVLSDAVKQARKEADMQTFNYYVVPGYDQAMSASLLPLSTGTDEVAWTYGHPYTRSDDAPPLPLYRANNQHPLLNYGTSQHGSIATLMPHFPDDPKSRFIAEIARDAHELRAPSQQSDENSQNIDKRRRLEDGTAASVADSQGAESAISSSAAQVPRSSPSLRKLQRERAALDVVKPDEFWERMGFRQECCAGNAVGVFVCLFEVARDKLQELEHTTASQEVVTSSASRMVAAQPMSLPQSILPDLIRRHLMRDACVWSDSTDAVQLTRLWDDGVRTAVLRKGSVGEAVDKGEKLGEGVVWCDIECNGPTAAQRAAAERAWEAAGKPMPQKAASQPKVVNSLSVKRKKKAA